MDGIFDTMKKGFQAAMKGSLEKKGFRRIMVS